MGGGVGKDLEVDGRGAQFDSRFQNLIVIEWYRRCIILERERPYLFVLRLFTKVRVVLTIPHLIPFSLSPFSSLSVVEREEVAQDWSVAYPPFKRDSPPPPSKDWRVAYPAFKREEKPAKDWMMAYPAFKRGAKDKAASDWRVAYPAY